MLSQMKILCVAAHPDDEVIGVGGTLARHVANDDEVRVCVLAEAEAARHEEITPDVRRLIENRRDGTRRACERLGIQSMEFYTSCRRSSRGRSSRPASSPPRTTGCSVSSRRRCF